MAKPSAWWRRLIAPAEIAGDVDQQDIAHRLGVSKSAVTGWKGGTEPRPDACGLRRRRTTISLT